MAVCGLLSMLCVSPIQPDMDSCPSHSSGATRNNFWQSGTGPRAASCLSSTMVDHNDPDDSGSSQPPTPTRTASESRHLVNRDVSLPRHELELSISSLNDAQRSTPQRLRSVKDEFDPTSASTAREDTLGGSRGVEEETSFSGPPRKRARMSPIGFRLEENQAGNVREAQLLRHPSLSPSSDVTGLHSLMPSRSLPSFRTSEREPSPAPSRGASGQGSKPTTSWWLAQPGPKSSSMIPTEAQHSFQTVQDSARGNFAIDARGMIPGTSLQEKDFIFKEPSFFPNMLSSMETSEQVRRREDSPTTSRARTEQGRPHALPDPRERPFFSRKESSTSRLSNISMVSEETVPRSGTPGIFSLNRETSLQEASTAYGQQIQRPFEGGRRPHPSASESQLAGHEREPPQGSFTRPQQADQRTMLGLPGGNANIAFYSRILDAAQQPVSSPFSQAGFPGSGFNPGGLGFNFTGQSLPRTSSQIGVGPVHFGTGGEAATSNLVQQQVNSEVLRNLLAANPSIGSIPPFMSPVQNPDPVRLSFPNLNSLDFLQSLQRQAFPSQGTDRYRQPAPGQLVASHPPGLQDFPFLGAPQPSHRSSSAELHPSLPPRGSQPGNVQSSSGLRDFLSSQGFTGSPSVGLGRGPATGPRGFSSSALEFPTHLSLQAPAASPPLTVVMEERSIGRRIVLQDYEGYDSFAVAMRTMVDSHVSSQEPRRPHGENCTLANAITGHVIAYEDEEGDILLAGDLPWRDFVRVAKQIRIISSSRISFEPTAGPSHS